MKTGSDTTRLIIIRGNSGSGKSTLAKSLRERYGRGIAWVSQDIIRREILREKDTPAGTNIGLIDLTARYALNNGYHVVLDGILYARHYSEMLLALTAEHQGLTRCYYMDIPFEETVARHAQRPQASSFSPEAMRGWYVPVDIIPGLDEAILDQHVSLDESIERIMTDTGLLP